MISLHFRHATRVYLKTLPFVVLRSLIGIFFGIVAIVYFGAVGWGVYTLVTSTRVPWLGGLFIAVISIGVFLGGWRFINKYILYLVKAAHIATIVEIIETGDTPSNQVRYGITKVKDNFLSTSGLFAVDLVVKGVLKQLNSKLVSLGNLVSFIPSAQMIVRIVAKSISVAGSYVDEAIVAYMFLHSDQNKWRSARDGVVLYGKNWKPVLATTLVMVAALYVLMFFFVVALVPVGGYASQYAPALQLGGWSLVVGIAGTIHIGLLRPWVKTVIITTFLIEQQDDTPDSETMEWIEQRSDKFSELMDKSDDQPEDTAHQPASEPTQQPPQIGH